MNNWIDSHVILAFDPVIFCSFINITNSNHNVYALSLAVSKIHPQVYEIYAITMRGSLQGSSSSLYRIGHWYVVHTIYCY